MTVFVDTSVLIGWMDTADQYHERAIAVVRSIEEHQPVTSDHVVLATWMMLRRRAGYEAAEQFLDHIRRTPIVLETVAIGDLERARSIGEAWSDQRFDLTDRTSFAVMERIGCSRVASFDTDFAVYRYGPQRRSAFEIIR